MKRTNTVPCPHCRTAVEIPDYPPDGLKVWQAAKQLGVSESQMWEWIRTGEVKSSLLSQNVRRVPRSEVLDFLARKLTVAAVPSSEGAA